MTKTDANWLYDWLTGEGKEKYGWMPAGGNNAQSGSDAGWSEVTSAQAQALANKGLNVVGVQNRYPTNGHVVVVVPGSLQKAQSTGKLAPSVMTAGMEDVQIADDVFFQDARIRYFVNYGIYDIQP